MTITTLLRQYIDKLKPCTQVYGQGNALISVYHQAEAEKIQTLEELAELINSHNLTSKADTLVKAAIKQIAKKRGEDPTTALSLLVFRASNSNETLRFDYSKETIIHVLRNYPALEMTACALAYAACLKPKDILQVVSIDDGLIKFDGRLSRRISSDYLDIVDEFVPMHLLKSLQDDCCRHDNPELDRTVLMKKVSDLRKNGFPFTLRSLSMNYIVHQSLKEGADLDIVGLAQQCGVQPETLENNIRLNWRDRNNISVETYKQLINK